MGEHRVRTSFNPSVVLHVDDAEFTDLKRQGLLLADADVARLDAADKPADTSKKEA